MAAGDLAMVAVYPTATEAGRIAASVVGGAGEEASLMHVTMVFLGEADEVDLKAAARAVGSVSGSTAPLAGKIGGAGVFGEMEKGYPQIAIPDVPGLAKMRTDLIDALAEEEITTPSEHDWVPHMTIDYVTEALLPDLGVIGVPLTFSTLSLVVNDERKDFPLDPEGSSDDVHRPDRSGLSRAEQRRLAVAELKR